MYVNSPALSGCHPYIRELTTKCHLYKFLQIFQKKIRSPGDQRPKYFMAQ